MTRTDSIATFLQNSNSPEDLSILYDYAMEVQVQVAQDHGERIDKEYKGHGYHAYTDGIQTWKNFRIPYKADSEPEYEDVEMNFDLAAHAEGIGLTGWNWVNRESQWVAFDFDAIVGHSHRHSKKLTDEELKGVQNSCASIPWVTVRRSTSGKGLHLYVFFDTPVQTQTHNEHAALARAVLGMLSAKTGVDFSTKVDACGGVMWVWHRKLTNNPYGLELIKSGVPLLEIPVNWKDHIPVIKGTKKKAKPRFIEDSEQDTFDELVGKKSVVPLDAHHKKLIDYLEETNALWWWDSDRNMLVCHTYDLLLAHKDLKLKGVFTTMATGKEHGQDENCYGFPLRNGGWVIRRHTPGVMESDTWEQDGEGWTKCYLNVEPNLKIASTVFNGLEDTDGSFNFDTVEKALKALEFFNVHPRLPDWIKNRTAKIKRHKDGRIIVMIPSHPGDQNEMKGWLNKKDNYIKLFSASNDTVVDPDIGEFDDMVRHLVTEGGENSGWVLKSEGGWREEPLEHLRVALGSMGYGTSDIKNILGAGIIKCWTVVSRPFQVEYPGNRCWNRKAAQLRFTPIKSDLCKYPTWLSILNHCGASLDDKLKDHPWAIINGIKTGADYLKCWVASLFQFPEEPLPYLFFYSSEQNTGKSSFHEAICLLMTSGYISAKTALTSPGDFNGELQDKILGTVEEVDLSGHKQAYNKIKEWVTARELLVHPKRETPYHVKNMLHFIQCSNDHRSCPIFPNDTRITMINVPPLDPLTLIPKSQLIEKLEAEAPYFLGEILNLEIPPSGDRLNLPVIDTEDKINISDNYKPLIDRFVDDNMFKVNGESVKFSEFYTKFVEWLDPEEVVNWTKQKATKALPPTIPKGRLRKDNQLYIGNISWTQVPATQPKWRQSGNHLVQDRES